MRGEGRGREERGGEGRGGEGRGMEGRGGVGRGLKQLSSLIRSGCRRSNVF